MVFWLVEELLDSQTIDGCRTVFDYLDSRRDRLTAKHFKQKNLIILRSCNELLRRLSRAEDTVFCGRVFIFLFQSFPLGDKSSVNLRGEYHVENVTTFEQIPSKKSRTDPDDIELEKDKNEIIEGDDEGTAKPVLGVEGSSVASKQETEDVKATEEVSKDSKPTDPEPEMDQLYTIFWSLQENFSQPTKLFDEAKLISFKDGLHATLKKFKAVQQERQTRGSSRSSEDGVRVLKRKRGPQEDELSSAFNPKYLTSRDLFDLEISDLAFRRHILVQALILIDFLLSLTPKAKKKLEQMSNRSVLYAYTLNEENANWAASTRSDIATYLQQGPEGKFYYRMVDTVLSRDKNWTHWKAEACPLIERSAISPEDFESAIKSTQRACASKKLRSAPLGTLDLGFLESTPGDNGLEKLKNPERFSIPTAGSFEGPIQDYDFEIDTAKSDEERAAAEDARSSKIWKTLRIASKDQLYAFDKIDDGKNIQVLFHPESIESYDRDLENGEQDREATESQQNVADQPPAAKAEETSPPKPETSNLPDAEGDAGGIGIVQGPTEESTVQ